MSPDPNQSPNQFQKTPSPTPQERIAQFIAAVEHSLSEADVSNDERQNVTADLRVQIEEMLSARTEGKTPTLEDVQAVLSELDPPESYCETEPGESQKPQPADESCCGPRDGRSRGHGHHRGHWGGKWFWRRRHVAQAIRQAIGSFSPLGNPLFAGFTHRSRAALAIAKNEARSMGHEYIGTEHLLLGLLLEGTGVAAKVLTDLGITTDAARREIARLVPPGTSAVTAERLPLTPRLRQAIEEARLAARNLHHDFLGTEHLLMGLMDVPGVAAESLKTLGLNSQQVKDAILQRIPAWTEDTAPAGGFTYWPASAAQTLTIGKNQYRIIASGADTGGFYAAVEANSLRARRPRHSHSSARRHLDLRSRRHPPTPPRPSNHRPEQRRFRPHPPRHTTRNHTAGIRGTSHAHRHFRRLRKTSRHNGQSPRPPGDAPGGDQLRRHTFLNTFTFLGGLRQRRRAIGCRA
jgi:hypothetical protein